MSRTDVGNASFKLDHEKHHRRERHREHKKKRDTWEKNDYTPDFANKRTKGRRKFVPR